MGLFSNFGISNTGKIFGVYVAAWTAKRAFDYYTQPDNQDDEALLIAALDASPVYQKLCAKHPGDPDAVMRALHKKGFSLNQRDFERVLKVRWPF